MLATSASSEARALGQYVYGIVAAGTRPSLDGFAMDDRYGARLVKEGGLAAIVSDVPLAEFGEEPLAENLGDPAWLGGKARAHDAVLERALRAGAVVPFRFGTVYVTEAGVRDMLGRDEEMLAGVLDRVAGKREWGLKGFADPDRLSDWLRASREDPDELPEAEGPGSAYLARKRVDRLVEEDTQRALAEIARECHGRLVAASSEARLLAPRGRGELFLNGVYLVEESREDDWHEAVRLLARLYADRGVELEPTGPWPAYNFVAEEPS